MKYELGDGFQEKNKHKSTPKNKTEKLPPNQHDGSSFNFGKECRNGHYARSKMAITADLN